MFLMAACQHILLLGPPACGKGTQARRVAEYLNLPCLGTGKLLRDEVEQKTELGLKVAAYLEAGDYAPDDLVLEIVKQWVETHGEGFIFDGFPRTIPQAEALERIQSPDIVIGLEVGKAELERRITSRRECGNCGETVSVNANTAQVCPFCGSDHLKSRSDDQLESFQNRYKVYQALTAPLLSYYKEKGVLVSVDGTGDPEVIFKSIMRVIQSEKMGC